MASFCFIFAAQRNQFVLLHLPEFPWTSQIPIDFPLISHWFPIDFPLISHWFPIHFPLISHWFPIDFPLISHWFPIDFPSFFTFHPHFPKEPGATTALQAAVAPNLLARVLMVAMGLTAMLYAELKLATWRLEDLRWRYPLVMSK